MKVVIGKYPRGRMISTFFDHYLDKKYSYNWPKPEDYSRTEKFLNSLQRLVQKLYNLTYNKFFSNRHRKISVRIDDHDVWNMDNTLSHIILPMLVRIREAKQGAPFVDDEDVPEHLRSTTENPYDTDENHFKRWEYVLDEMIYNFKCEVDPSWEDQFHKGNIDFDWVEAPEKNSLKMNKGPNHTYAFDKALFEKSWERRKNGLRLFGKYFTSLWT